MIVTDAPDVKYTYRRNIIAEDALMFIAELESLDPSAIVGYLSGNLQATRGAWVRIGRYRIANDSFIDPSDLMLYVASYYKPDATGTIEALELNHGDAPDNALKVTTVDELLDALAQLDICENQDGINEATGESATESASASGFEQETDNVSNGEAELPAMPSRLEGMIILEPASAPEMHGALVKGWRAMCYEAPDGSSLLAFG